jgi:hypothetical protein
MIDVAIALGMLEDSQTEGGKKTNGLTVDRNTLGGGDGLLGCLSDLAYPQQGQEEIRRSGAGINMGKISSYKTVPFSSGRKP